MKRILLVIAYDGTNYSGWAYQKDQTIPTIEGAVEKALQKLTGESIIVIGASRTDSGVHALCNYCVFDTDSSIPPEKFAPAMNAKLPEDIRIRKSFEVPMDFHPRSAVTEKTYEYKIYVSRIEDPTKTRYAHYTWFRMDVDKMREAAAILVGEHDFKSFANVATTALTTVREITDIQVESEEVSIPSIMCSPRGGVAEQDKAFMITIRVSGKGFLYNMVRIIAGTLMEVGRGLRTPEQVREMLEAKDRQASGPTAPACGLTLVNYRFLDSFPSIK